MCTDIDLLPPIGVVVHVASAVSWVAEETAILLPLPTDDSTPTTETKDPIGKYRNALSFPVRVTTRHEHNKLIDTHGKMAGIASGR